MIRNMKNAWLAALAVFQVVMLSSAGFSALAQQRAYRVSDQQVETVLRRIETRTDAFRSSLMSALDQSRLDTTRREDNINQFVADFEAATDRLRDRFDNRQSVAADVRDVLDRAAYIDDFMQRHRLAYRAEQDWNLVRSDLNLLANYYNVTWRWDSPAGRGFPTRAANRLTGTYRLDESRSDRIQDVIDRATSGLSADERQRLTNRLTRRLEAPEMIAIERSGNTVTMASSRAPQATFEADGRTRTEQTRRGRQVRVNAQLIGDRLTVSSTGERGNDYQVTFDPIDYGQRLRVTRRIDIPRLSQPVTVVSVYDKTSEVAQWNIVNDRWDDSTTPAPISGEYAVTRGTEMVAVLNETLTTETTREGDRFTLTVRSPSRYDGAIIEGHVTEVDRAGRFTGRPNIALDFDRIRMRDGSTYPFEGYMVSVRTRDGEDIRVDNEDVIEAEDTQGETTLKRGGIGAAIGAIIGAIAGGGEGAAIGAAIGAGAGAGSVYVTGREDLKLESGTEITLRAQTPRYESRR
ncbi:MAG TPA: hypothetical protein VNO70_03010 [Blastocatellia bacterium]|nr:hypothetical protein [Blastocatellia bacterium]